MLFRHLLMAVAALLWSTHSAAYERAISLAPHITELIYAIGAEDKLIATVESSDYPPAALAIPRVGDGVSLSAEQILSLRPDVVFAWQPTRALQAVEPLLAQSQIDLHYLNPRSMDEILELTLQLGNWLDQPINAQTLYQGWQKQLSALAQRYQSSTPKTLFIVLSSKPLYSLNDAVINDALRHCGAYNWASDLWGAAPAIPIEQLLARPFQGILYTRQDKALDDLLQFLHVSKQASIPLYKVNADHFHRPGPRLIESLSPLCEQISMQQ